MKTEFNEGILKIFIEGRIDSTSAEKFGADIDAELAGTSHSTLILDAGALEYISSAGLRVILRIRKSEKDMKIVNVSSEVYEIFDMTGFTEMIDIEKAYRQMNVDGCTVIGKGAKGTVYRYNGDTVIKVYNDANSLPDIKNERELARRAFVLGIPTAISYDIVKVGESYGSVFELLDAKSYSQLIAEDPDNIDKYVSEYALLLKKIHSTIVKPEDMPDIKPHVLKWADAAAPYISASASAKARKLIEAVPDTLNMLHCDYHTNNVMSQNGETLLIDMDTLSHGHPIFELANVYITYVGFGESDPSNVEKFLGIKYETAKEVWEKFLPIYLGTDDKARLLDIERKIKLLSSLRVIRHTVHRTEPSSPLYKKSIDMAAANIESLIGTIDTLDF